MYFKAEPKRIPYSFWLALLIHVLLLLSILYSIQIQPPKEEQATTQAQYVPAYTYTPSTPLPTAVPKQAKPTQEATKDTPKEPSPTQATEAKSLDIPMPSKAQRSRYAVGKKMPSMFAASMAALQQNQLSMLKAKKSDEPVYIVGDLNGVSDPLIQMLGRALSKHFAYPKMAGQMGAQGRVVISMTLHPDGHLSDIQMLQSSNNDDLDSAALYATNSAPVIPYVDRFLSEPKHFVIGFIFRQQ